MPPSRRPDPDPPHAFRPLPADTPWIETRAGGLFFVNVLLVTPAAVVLFPLVLGAALRAAGVVQGPSRMLDTIPLVASHFLPWVGWLAAPAAWLAWKNLRIVDRPWAKGALAAFLAVHVGTVALAAWRWVT